MAIKLVLCDMDGTLVPFGSEAVSQRTIAAVHRLMDAGIHFGPSSGREHSDIVRFFGGDESCLGTGIMGGGKQVFVDDTLVYRRIMPHDLLQELADTVRDIPGMLLNFYLPTDEQGRGRPEFGIAGMSEDELQVFSEDVGMPYVGTFFRQLPQDITTAAIGIDVKQGQTLQVVEGLRAAFSGLDFVQSAPFAFDVMEKGWSKVNALPIISEHLGVSVDEIAYFGDSHNDLTMMTAIPNSFCPVSGLDETKEVARYVIGACEDDGVAEVLESLAAQGGEIVPSDWSL